MGTSVEITVVLLMAGGIVYNIIATTIIAKNDLRHLEAEIKEHKELNCREHDEIKGTINQILNKLMEK